MAANPATAFFTPMASVVSNLGGALQALAPAYQMSARERVAGGVLTLVAQASATIFGLARIRLPFVISGITVINSASLGSATLAMGDAGSGNTAIYFAAQTFTSVNTPTRVGLAATHFSLIQTGYDCVSGLATTYSSGQSAAPGSPGGFGGLYEDFTVTTAAAALPASGTLAIIIEYAID